MVEPWREIDASIVQLAKELQTERQEVETSDEELLIKINETLLSDTELDLLVGLVWDELAELLSIEIHSPTLQVEIVKNGKWYENDICNGADWQKLRTQEINHDEL